MIALAIIFAIIVLAILAILAILLFRFKIGIKYSEELILYVQIFFIKIKLWPIKKRKRKVRISKYSKRNLAKRAKKEAKKKKPKETEAKKKKKAPSEKKEEAAKEPLDIREILRLVRLLVSIIIRRFFKHLRIDVAKLNITVATDSAADTAIMYGYVYQGVAYIIELLDNFTNLKRSKRTEISVVPDFLSDKTRADIHIAFSLTLLQALDILAQALFGTVRSKFKI